MQPQLLVQSLQGMRAQILFAFLFAGHAMDVDELMTWTGRSRQHHYVHLSALCVTGLLAKQTMAHGRDVYLLGSELLPALQAWVAQIGAGAHQLGSGLALLQESQKVTPGDAVIVLNPPQLTYIHSSLNNNNKAQESQKVTPETQMSGKRTPDEYSALLDALAKHKIIGSTKNKLIACEWVSAEYVLASVEYAIAEGKGKFAVGIAINRMLDQIEQPTRKENGHIENCQCDICAVPESNRASYSDWWKTPCADCGKINCECPHDDDCECMDCRRNFPERFCKAIYEYRHGNVRGVYHECHDLAVPGTRYCAEHQDPSTRGHYDQDGKETRT